jgi:hypothetical protein
MREVEAAAHVPAWAERPVWAEAASCEASMPSKDHTFPAKAPCTKENAKAAAIGSAA